MTLLSPCFRVVSTDAENFEIELFPYRSLSRQGGRILTAGIALVAGGVAVTATLAGAWPVGVVGLLPLGMRFALAASFKGGQQKQVIRLQGNAVVIDDYPPMAEQPANTQNYKALFMKVSVTDEPEEDLMLRAGGQTVRIGTFLPRPERHKVAEILDAAIRNWHTPPHLRHTP